MNYDPTKEYPTTEFKDGRITDNVVVKTYNAPEPLSLEGELARLYALEMNVTISSDWDAQYYVCIGNKYSPPKPDDEAYSLTLPEVVAWLATKGRE